MAVTIGQPVNFEAMATGDKVIRMADLKGHQVVLYFYPKDNTSGCTAEGLAFTAAHAAFAAANTLIFGVSRDSLKSHEKFKTNQMFPFDLISDPEETLCRIFDVIKPKKLYGKEYMGIERSTFLIDREGILRSEWRKVTVSGHVAEVLVAARELNN